MLSFIESINPWSQARRERQRAAEAEARAAAYERSLVEAYRWGPFWSQDGLSPEPLFRGQPGRDDWFPLVANYLERRPDGTNGFFLQTEADLAEMRMLARWLLDCNPLVQGALEFLIDFVVGEGMTFRATTKDNARQGLVASVQDVIDEFNDRTEFDELQQELVRRSRRDGEYFLRCFDLNGYAALRLIEPEWVTQQEGPANPEWSWGLQHLVEGEDEDVQTILAYGVRPKPGSWEPVDAGEILHCKVNVDTGQKRGMSDLFSTADAFEGARKLLRNLREGASLQAAIAGIRKHTTGATRADADKMRDENRAALYGSPVNPVTRKPINIQHYTPGTLLDIYGGAEYQAPPWMSQGAPNHILILQAVLRAALIRWGMPEFFSGDASNANYASTLVAGSPFVRRVKRLQKFYERRFLAIVWKAVRYAAEAGRIPGASWEAVEHLVEIQAEAPIPEIANDLEQAQVDQGDMDRGVLSIQTRRQRRGLDDEQERVNLSSQPLPRAPGAFADLDPSGHPVPPQQAASPAGNGFFPAARESAVERRHEELREQYGERIAAGIAAAAGQLLAECGGEGGKPGPCPKGGGKDKDDGGKKKRMLIGSPAWRKQQAAASAASAGSTSTAMAEHPLAGKSKPEQARYLGNELAQQRDTDEHDTRGYDRGPPAGLDRDAFAADLRAALVDLPGGVGQPLDKIYAAVGAKHGLTVQGFQQAVFDQHARRSETGLVLSGWPKTLDEVPSPEHAMPYAGKLYYYLGQRGKDA